jgi:hypothetical protein
MPRTRPSSRRARRFRMEFSLSRNGSFGCQCDEWRTFDLNPIRVGGTQRNTAGCLESGERRELGSCPNERQFENGARGGAGRYTGKQQNPRAYLEKWEMSACLRNCSASILGFPFPDTPVGLRIQPALHPPSSATTASYILRSCVAVGFSIRVFRGKHVLRGSETRMVVPNVRKEVPGTPGR